MKNRKIMIVICVAAALAAAGCGKKEEPELGGLADVKEVVNFSDFKETEVPTEPETEPVTEPVTEPPTEPETEPETEPVTEPVTEPETEELPYEEDFDFSDEKILDAFYSVRTLDELSRQEGFSDTVSENEEQRTREISLHNGEVTILLYADQYSGTTNGKLEVKAASQFVGSVKEALVAMDAGLHEDKQLSSSQAKDFVEIVNRLMKDNLSLDMQKALFKGLPKFMEKHSLEGYMIPVDTIHMGKEKAYLEKQEDHVFGFVPEDRKGSLLGVEQNGWTNYLYFASRQDEKTLRKIMESMQKDVPNFHGGCISINDIYRVISSCIQTQEDEMKFCGIQMYFTEFGM